MVAMLTEGLNVRKAGPMIDLSRPPSQEYLNLQELIREGLTDDPEGIVFALLQVSLDLLEALAKAVGTEPEGILRREIATRLGTGFHGEF